MCLSQCMTCFFAPAFPPVSPNSCNVKSCYRIIRGILELKPRHVLHTQDVGRNRCPWNRLLEPLRSAMERKREPTEERWAEFGENALCKIEAFREKCVCVQRLQLTFLRADTLLTILCISSHEQLCFFSGFICFSSLSLCCQAYGAASVDKIETNETFIHITLEFIKLKYKLDRDCD